MFSNINDLHKMYVEWCAKKKYRPILSAWNEFLGELKNWEGFSQDEMARTLSINAFAQMPQNSEVFLKYYHQISDDSLKSNDDVVINFEGLKQKEKNN